VESDGDGEGVNNAVDGSPDPLAVYVSKTDQEQVRAAIQQLPVEFREIIILRNGGTNGRNHAS
jgi:RNA polymerase sigma-70 factor, ECF subfamily